MRDRKKTGANNGALQVFQPVVEKRRNGSGELVAGYYLARQAPGEIEARDSTRYRFDGACLRRVVPKIRSKKHRRVIRAAVRAAVRAAMKQG